MQGIRWASRGSGVSACFFFCAGRGIVVDIVCLCVLNLFVSPVLMSLFDCVPFVRSFCNNGDGRPSTVC